MAPTKRQKSTYIAVALCLNFVACSLREAVSCRVLAPSCWEVAPVSGRAPVISTGEAFAFCFAAELFPAG